MLDLKLLRQDIDAVAHRLRKRHFTLAVSEWAALETRRKALQMETQAQQQAHNQLAKKIGQAKASGAEVSALLQEAEQLSATLKSGEADLSALQAHIEAFALTLPNLLDDSVPEGGSEADNLEVSRVGTPRVFEFPPQDHVVLGEGLGQMDFESAAKLSGSRFVVLKGGIARLHRALAQFMLDTHLAHGYQECYVPYLVKQDCFLGTGQLPKFSEDFFSLAGNRGLGLISTAEISLTNMARETIFDAAALPILWMAHTPCFRSESGSYGRDTRGMLRQHQFDKVELVQLVRPEASDAALERLTGHAETILKKLALPYRKVLLCGGDTSFSAAKTYDLEVWLPGQSRYREISSCSNCTDFQARRMQARWRNPETKKPELLHTLNGSGLAVGRTLIAVLENYQEADGSVTIPEVLRPYMSGLERMVRI